MPRAKSIATCDCETDPFEHGFDLKPFLWGFYDGKNYHEFNNTDDFVGFVRNRRIILYAHNGGKFDFMFLLKYLQETRAQIINGRFVSLYVGDCELRDSYSIIPEPLKNFGNKKEIDYVKLTRENRDKHKEEISEYLRYDCVELYKAVSSYRKQAGKLKTIASNALAFSKKLGIDPGKTNARFDENYRKYYYGGRTECFQPGTHHNVKIIDIHSAYPFAMSHYHATGSDFLVCDDFSGMSTDDINRSFVTLECFSKGAFPQRSGNQNGLFFPIGYDRYNVTGWEFTAALSLGLLSDIKIVSVRYTKDKITFKPYIDYWYEYKRTHPKAQFKIEYTIGKIMMNSLYGKLAQNPARYKDYKIVPAGTPICWEYVEGEKGFCKACGEHSNHHGWQLEMEYEGHEIHARESLWRWKHELGTEWKGKALYKNVATGASITGFTRAHLLRAMSNIGFDNVIYCDTDGIVTKGCADLSGISFTDLLGDWELEEDNAPIGHFAGKKLYGIELSSGKHKIASKGARLEFRHLERIVAGETVTWKSPAPSFHIDGSFDYVVRNIRSTAKTASL